jgi:hypothetical protein
VTSRRLIGSGLGCLVAAHWPHQMAEPPFGTTANFPSACTLVSELIPLQIFRRVGTRDYAVSARDEAEMQPLRP